MQLTMLWHCQACKPFTFSQNFDLLLLYVPDFRLKNSDIVSKSSIAELTGSSPIKLKFKSFMYKLETVEIEKVLEI